MYLLDTNVVSELRRTRPHGAVLAWLRDVAEDDLHLSAMTFGEIQAGIETTREQDPDKAAGLKTWLEEVAASYNVIAADAAVLRQWARLMHRRSDTLIEDAIIAATAAVHRLTVVTCNVRDFAPFKVETLDPFTSARS